MKYIITKPGIYTEDIIKLATQKYPIVDEATYHFSDDYYDDPRDFSFLEQGKALRIRHGHTQYCGEQSRSYKNKRITYKTYEEEGDTTYTNRAKQEEIGSSMQLKDYTEFLSSISAPDELKNTLNVNGYRKLITVEVNGQLIDISFCVASYQNCIYEMPGVARTIEIRPRDNQIIGRTLLLQVKRELELKDSITNANIYEIGMVDTYDKYKKGYIVSEDAVEFEKENPTAAQKLATIVEELKRRRHMTYVTQTPPVEELKGQKVVRVPEGEEI